MCGGGKGGQRAESRFRCAPVSLICTNGDDRVTQLINHDTHGTANEFDLPLVLRRGLQTMKMITLLGAGTVGQFHWEDRCEVTGS